MTMSPTVTNGKVRLGMSSLRGNTRESRAARSAQRAAGRRLTMAGVDR